MNNEEKGLRFVNKAHCYRTLVGDMEPGKCSVAGNQCRYCYDQVFTKVRAIHENKGELKKVTIDAICEQLESKCKIREYLDRYKIVRIGALGDISPSTVDEYRKLLQVIAAHGYKYIIVTKSAHCVNEHMLDDIRLHNGIIHVSMGYYSVKECNKFERVERLPPRERRKLIKRALDIGANVVLRLNPMHPEFMHEHLEVLRWYAGVGGTRVILETIRIMEDWVDSMPAVDFSKFVRYTEDGEGGFYRNYRTPDNHTHENLTLAMMHAARTLGIDKITVCGDMHMNDKYGYKADSIDCCQACDILDVERTPRTWEEDSIA